MAGIEYMVVSQSSPFSYNYTITSQRVQTIVLYVCVREWREGIHLPVVVIKTRE
jgi:hypothetical protein